MANTLLDTVAGQRWLASSVVPPRLGELLRNAPDRQLRDQTAAVYALLPEVQRSRLSLALHPPPLPVMHNMYRDGDPLNSARHVLSQYVDGVSECSDPAWVLAALGRASRDYPVLADFPACPRPETQLPDAATLLGSDADRCTVGFRSTQAMVDSCARLLGDVVPRALTSETVAQKEGAWGQYTREVPAWKSLVLTDALTRSAIPHAGDVDQGVFWVNFPEGTIRPVAR